jgi:FecR protein
MIRWNTALLILVGALSAPAFGASPVRPGTINYVEGSADLAGQPITMQSIRSVEVGPGQTLETNQGKAEVLLTPGIFLRLGENSAIQMISPDLTNTTVALTRGQAMVEVDQIFSQNNIQVMVGNVSTQLLKPGLYGFDASRGRLAVYGGKAAVREGDNQFVVVKGHRDFALATNDDGKPQKFNVSASRDDLYKWSSLRSQYLAEENSEIAGNYAGVSGFVPGWYWDPYFWNYTFIGAGPLWSPFGWGFYPPYYFAGGFYGYGYGYGRGYYGGRGFEGGHAYHGAMMSGGGFHGGGAGGFHGGGGGGGHR